jgi:cysteinyl-tRNA synthetase
LAGKKRPGRGPNRLDLLRLTDDHLVLPRRKLTPTVPLKLYNTLTRSKELFTPINAQDVRMYVCGPTVYDFAHIGNARPVIVFDVLYRLLRQIYGADHVRYVRNITDVDDKINAAAKANNEGIRDLTERTAKAFHEDVAALGCLPPDVEPRATEHIPQMIAMIERLIAAGNAYEAQGHVLFAVASDPSYGKLSRRNRDDMIAGARVEVAPYKRDAADFVLWKPSPPDLPGWDSPWGRGRPGWHIECSAMSETHLGESFDIHGGGLDLIFPHHENEIAQSECVHHGKPFAQVWMHNGFVTVEGAKMSKSEGNFRTIRDVLSEWSGEIARTAMLLTHYRDPLDWTDDRLREANNIIVNSYIALRDVSAIESAANEPSPALLVALEDDLNTPLALRVVGDLFRALNKASGDAEKAQLKGEILAGCELLGILQNSPNVWLQTPRTVYLAGRATSMSFGRATATVSVSNEWVEERIAARNLARRAKNFTEADSIRSELALKGILLEDKPGGKTEWRRA